MYEILMPVDSNESRGTAQAEAVVDLPAASEEIRVTLLHVFDDEDREENTATKQIRGGNAARSRLEEAGVGARDVTRVGDPATEILAAAQETEADHIVLGGRKRSPLGSLLFGSVSQAVVLDSERPVTITGGKREE
ncbi:MAG: universal stress protein [Haloarculaceae archaeon]